MFRRVCLAMVGLGLIAGCSPKPIPPKLAPPAANTVRFEYVGDEEHDGVRHFVADLPKSWVPDGKAVKSKETMYKSPLGFDVEMFAVVKQDQRAWDALFAAFDGIKSRHGADVHGTIETTYEKSDRSIGLIQPSFAAARFDRGAGVITYVNVSQKKPISKDSPLFAEAKTVLNSIQLTGE